MKAYFDQTVVCATTCLLVLSQYSKTELLGFIFVPFITASLNTYSNYLISKEQDDIFKCLVFKLAFDYVTWFVQNKVIYKQVRFMEIEMRTRMNVAKIKCCVPIPGVNQKQYKDLLEDYSKLRDFLFVLPMFWTTLVNFSISIYKMETEIESNIPVKMIFTSLCVSLVVFLTYLSDASLYEKTKPNPKSITNFGDSNFVRMKLSMGCEMDTEFEMNKRNKMENQRNIQHYAIIALNAVITFISLMNKNIETLHSFGNISWMLGCLSDNIKSLQYHDYMQEFISFCQCLEKHKFEHEDKKETQFAIDKDIDKIQFVNASFGYYSEDLMKAPIKIQKIYNLNYIFKKNKLYYLEAPNGIGKSTILKMFQSNLFSGDVFFGNSNRKHWTFEEIQSIVFYIGQASEYTPSFSKEEIMAHKGRDTYLEERLGLKELLDKDIVEMSGGQKKRILIYIVLTSPAKVLLLDEILSELSTEETPDVPEGGGWLSRVISTLVEWKGLEKKIVILVGHGLLELIPKKPHIVKLKMENHDGVTKLNNRI